MSPRWARRLVGPVLLVLFGTGVGLSGTTLEAVVVELLPGAEEPGDGILGRDAPDYRLELRVHQRWVDCGTHADTRIGSGLRFEVPGPPTRGVVTELRLIEDDPANDDLLEELPLAGGGVEGKAFGFTLEQGWSLGAGLEWFLSTPAGVLLALGLMVAILVEATGLALRGTLES